MLGTGQPMMHCGLTSTVVHRYSGAEGGSGRRAARAHCEITAEGRAVEDRGVQSARPAQAACGLLPLQADAHAGFDIVTCARVPPFFSHGASHCPLQSAERNKATVPADCFSHSHDWPSRSAKAFRNQTNSGLLKQCGHEEHF